MSLTTQAAVGVNKVESFDQFQRLLNASNLSIEDLLDISQDKTKFGDVKLKKKYRNNKKVVEYLNNLLGNRSILTLDDEDLYNDIKNNFSDRDIVKHIYSYVSGKLKYIYERAKEFRKTIFKTYYDFEDPQKIVRKANAYIEQLNLTPIEKTIFFSMFKDNKPIFLTGNKTFDKYEESTQIARFFNMRPEQPSLNLSESDKIFYDEIAKYHKSHEFIYNYNVRITCEYIREYQKYTGTDSAKTTVSDKNSFNDFCNKYFNNVEIIQKYKYTNCVHPVIFILFGIPIGILEFYFNIASIGRLITYSHDHKKLTYFDKMVREQMADGTELRINSQGKNLSTIEDMFYRVKIQYALWKQVLLLRSKFFMSCDSTNFYNLLSVYSPNIFLESNGDITSDSINIISKLFSIINFKPITLQITYEYSKDDTTRDKTKDAITIFKKGRDDFYYAMSLSDDMLNNIQQGAEQYYQNADKTVKRSFIYIVMQDGKIGKDDDTNPDDKILGMRVVFSKSEQSISKKETKIVNNMIIKPIYNSDTNVSKSNTNFTVSNTKNKYFIKRSKIYNLISIEGVLIFIVIRNQNPIKKRSYINFNFKDESSDDKKEFSNVVIENDTEISDFIDTDLIIENLSKDDIESSKITTIGKLQNLTGKTVDVNLNNIVDKTDFVLNSFLSYSCRKTSDGRPTKGNPYGVIYNKDGYIKVKNPSKETTFEQCAKYLMYRPFDYKKSLSDSVDSVLFYNKVDLADKDSFFYKSLAKYSEIIIYVDIMNKFFDLNQLSNLDHIEYNAKSEK